MTQQETKQGWYDLTLSEIIWEYRGGGYEDNEPLDGDAVEDLVGILKAKINLFEGNITQEEYNKILG